MTFEVILPRFYPAFRPASGSLGRDPAAWRVARADGIPFSDQIDAENITACWAIERREARMLIVRIVD